MAFSTMAGLILPALASWPPLDFSGSASLIEPNAPARQALEHLDPKTSGNHV